MTIDSIQNGIVIDHIPANRSMVLYNALHLDNVDCSVAILKNVPSEKFGRKDIIKVDQIIDLNWDILGFIAPQSTVNIIRDGKLAEKKQPSMPETLVDIIKCKNPRCITTIEQGLKHIFRLTDREKSIYRCIYCETKAEKNSL